MSISMDDTKLPGHEKLRLDLIVAHRQLVDSINHIPIYSHDEIEVEKSLLAAQLQIEDMRELISSTWRSRQLPKNPAASRPKPTLDDLLSL